MAAPTKFDSIALAIVALFIAAGAQADWLEDLKKKKEQFEDLVGQNGHPADAEPAGDAGEDPGSHQSNHLEAPPVPKPASSQAESPTDYPPLAPVSKSMLIYKFAPDAFTQEELLKRASTQIRTDQNHYKNPNLPTQLQYKPLFAQAEVEGRNPEFVARELLDDYKASLARIASDLPTRYSGLIAVEIRDGGVVYDHSRGVLHQRSRNEYLVREAAITADTDIRNRVLYETGALARLSSTISFPLDTVFQYRPHDSSLAAAIPVSMASNVPLPGSKGMKVALDRLLEVPAVAVEIADAERMLTPPTNPGLVIGGQKAKYYEEMKRYFGSFMLFVDLELTGIQTGERSHVLLANILGAKLLGTRGELLKTYAPSDFPSAATLQAERSSKEEAERAAAEAEQQKMLAAESRKQADELAAEQARQERIDEMRETLRNADIVNVRLGMTMPEAEKVIRERMEVKWVAQLPAESPKGLQPYGHFKTFISKDGSEQIALFWHPDVSDRIVAVTRSLRLPDGASSDAVIAQLLDKYGDQPAKKDDSSIVWTVDFGNQRLTNVAGIDNAQRLHNGTCNSQLGESSIHDLQVVEGAAFTMYGDGAPPRNITRTVDIRVWGGRLPEKRGGYSNDWDPAQWQKCGPMVVAGIRYRDQGTSAEQSYLSLGLHDLAAYAPHYAGIVKTNTRTVDLDL